MIKINPAQLAISTVAAAVIAGAVSLSPVFAQDSSQDLDALSPNSNEINIVAMPPRWNDDAAIRIAPGETQQVDLRVNNASDNDLVIRSEAIDFIVAEDGETPIAVDNELDNRYSLAKWVTIAPGQQTVTAGETVGVSVLISVPEDALPGGKYAMVVHQPNTNYDSLDSLVNAQSTGISQKVGSLLYVIVDGMVNEEAYIRNFTVPRFLEYGPVEYSFEVENQSDIHIRPQMSIEITNMFGAREALITPETKNIFPLDSRTFSGSWEKIWGFGRYTAKITMSYGSEGQVVMSKAHFWLLPVKLVLTGLTVLLALIAAGVATRRHMIHRNTDQGKRIQELEKRIKDLQDSNKE